MKLNIKPNNETHTVEEKVELVDGKYIGILKHDNVIKSTILINSKPQLVGDFINNYTTSSGIDKPWETTISIYADYSELYISYETYGDQVDADDYNYLNSVKLEMKDLPEMEDLSKVKDKLSELNKSKAEKTHSHKANDITFDDGDSFQEKLDRGELKGEDGRPGKDGTDAIVTKEKIIGELGYIPEDQKHTQSEVERLEKTINEIIVGDSDGDRVIPHITNNPVMNELYYKQLPKDPPVTYWYPDDWGIWTVVNQNHLQCKASRTYDALNTRISGNPGTINIQIVKKDKNDRHRLSLERNGEIIYDVRETRGDKEYTLKVKPGDGLTIVSLFEGDVYLEYEGEPGDYRLYAYKNGVEERVANAYLVEKELNKYITRDEANSKIGDLDKLETNEKIIVDAINEINSKSESEEVDLSGYAKLEDIPTRTSELYNDTRYLTRVNWDVIENKPLTFKPESHTHYEYLSKIEDLQNKIDNIDIPDEVDLTPIYEMIEELKNTALKKDGITCSDLRGF